MKRNKVADNRDVSQSIDLPIDETLKAPISYSATWFKKSFIKEAERRCHLETGCRLFKVISPVISRKGTRSFHLSYISVRSKTCGMHTDLPLQYQISNHITVFLTTVEYMKMTIEHLLCRCPKIDIDYLAGEKYKL